MYDISSVNSVSELEELIRDMQLIIRDKETDPKVKEHCNRTITEARRKIAAIRRNSGI